MTPQVKAQLALLGWTENQVNGFWRSENGVIFKRPSQDGPTVWFADYTFGETWRRRGPFKSAIEAAESYDAPCKKP